jgi:sugar/nucleoside kinase (ribokinase family)
MLAVNFAFTFPYFEFNFIILENLVSAIVMLIISMMTSVLTTELKRQEKMRMETEKEKMRANLLRAISHDLRTPLTTIYGSSSVMAENAKELTKEQMQELAEDIRGRAEQAKIRRLVVTMGENGAAYTETGRGSGYCYAKNVDIIDTTGCGDAFFAGVAVGLTYGKTLKESCEIGTVLASSVIATNESVCPSFRPEEFGLKI